MPADAQRQLDVDIHDLIDSSPIVQYLAKPEGCYELTFVSAAAEANTGFTPERLIAEPGLWISRVHPDDRERVARRAAVVEPNEQRQEYRFQHASGEWRWVYEQAKWVRDEAGLLVAISGVWLDITDHKRAEITLQRQNAFSESLIENAPAIVLILDENARVTKVNPHFEKLTGYSATEVVGRDWFETMLPAQDRPRIRALFGSVMMRGVNAGYVNPIVAKDGRLLQIEWFGQALTNNEGRFKSLMNIGHDVTERIEHEQAREASKREAERANAAKSRFLVTASHDLRQPLQTLLLLNSALAKTGSDARQSQMLEMQSEALKEMSKLLNALLDIGKLESGAVEPEITDVPIRDVFRRIEAEFAVQARAKGLNLSIDDCSFTARTDADLLNQLVLNLVANAIRYTHEGTVRLSCHAETDQLEITVQDTGVGIPEDQREAIFDEFYQVDRASSHGGLGLGLSIVKRIAGLLGARIEVESQVGAGSTFSVTVARGDDAVSQPAAAGAFARPNAGGTILLVDDDAAVLAASRIFFEINGYEVVAASSPRDVEAAMAGGSGTIDLIVTDYHLKERQTGLDIISAVRRKLRREVPAILVTGDTSPAVGEVMLAGLESMSKPVDTNRLLSIAENLIAAAPRAGRAERQSDELECDR